MNVIHFRLIPKSPTVTPWRGDTLVGHLLWAYAYQYGSTEMDDLFARISLPCHGNENTGPPIVSDLFPENYLPIPLLPAFSKSDESKELALANRKAIKKIRWIPIDDWETLRDHLTPTSLYNTLMSIDPKKLEDDTKVAESAELHASINRLNGTTSEAGGLYARVVRREVRPLHGYLYRGALGEDAFELLRQVGESGYGADASTGCGQFDIVRLEEENWNQPNAKYNGWMSLGRHLPDAKCDPRAAKYRLVTHYGRLGGSLANRRYVFKKPILLCETGSLWKESFSNDRFPGFMLDKTVRNTDLDVRHLAYTLPYWLNWENK